MAGIVQFSVPAVAATPLTVQLPLIVNAWPETGLAGETVGAHATAGGGDTVTLSANADEVVVPLVNATFKV
jgi:hypothetical protein